MSVRSRVRGSLVVAGLVVGMGFAAGAAAQMPDIGEMSGVPLPSADLPAGSVSVRVVRGDLTNNVAGQPVELHVGEVVQRVVTDENGRAVFSGLAPGASVHAVATIDGRRLESQTFPVPAEVGMRVILVSGAAAGGTSAAAPAGGGTTAPPSTPGAMPGGGVPAAGGRGPAFGGQSRVFVELVDAAFDVYYVLDLTNPTGAPLAMEPIVITPPDEAVGLTVIEGSSPAAKADGNRFLVTGPFEPGVTSMQLAYQLPYSGPAVTLSQRFPLPLEQAVVFVRKHGDLRFSSAQVTAQRELQSNGNTYTAASGPGLPAGAPLEVALSGLPYRSQWPRYAALGLAGLILLAGIWRAYDVAGVDAEARRHALEDERERLLGELVRLEEQRRAGRGDSARQAARREAVVARLERVYAELDSGDAAFLPLRPSSETEPAPAN